MRSGIAHKGYGVDRLVGQCYLGLEGLFGVPLDVAATYIVLFTIYGAVLEYSGAARFFVELSYAAFGRSRTGPGPHHDAGRLPARHRLRLRRRDHGDARLGHLAAAAPGGLPEGRGRRRSSRRRASARSSRRRRSARPRSSSPSSSRSATSRCSLYAVVPTLLYYLGIAARHRGRRAALRGARARPRDTRLLAPARRAGATTSPRSSRSSCCSLSASRRSAPCCTRPSLAFLLSFLDKRDRMAPRGGSSTRSSPACAPCCPSPRPRRRPGSSSPSCRSPASA